MRIISGIYKSRILKSPPDYKIRPTSDRAKETLFNILSNRINFEGITCMDLFCGSGNLGLECISRGASMCLFVDENVSLVKKNIEILKAEGKSKIVKSEVLNYLNTLPEEKIELVFCDPPYSYDSYDSLIEKISLLNTIFILEHSENFILNVKFSSNVFLNKKIGTVNFTFLDFKS